MIKIISVSELQVGDIVKYELNGDWWLLEVFEKQVISNGPRAREIAASDSVRLVYGQTSIITQFWLASPRTITILNR